MAANGIFCLEGEWDADMRKRRSVLPLLELLERLGEVKFIHRDVGTATEVARYLGKWSQSRYDDYRVLYLATHGDKGKLLWSFDRAAEASSTLEELAETLGDVAAGCYIHLGGCLTLFDTRQLQQFVADTGAAAVLGYRREVDWVEAAAFETPLLPLIAAHAGRQTRPETLFDQLMDRHGDLAKHLKFVVGASDKVYRAQDGIRSKDASR